MRNKHVAFMAEPGMLQELRAIASAQNRSLSNLIYQIVKNWLENLRGKK
jgi:hypothetical protein